MKKNSLYIISSLLFAFVLFIYATSINYQNNNNARPARTETYTNTVVNVPIDIRTIVSSILLAVLVQK